MQNNNIAMIGLAVMGANLARNIASRGYRVAVYNRTKEVTEEFVRKYSPIEDREMEQIPPSSEGQNQGELHPYYSLSELVASLEGPRKVMIMVKAGNPVDLVINDLLPLLETGDVIIDCGNSFYKDTIRRKVLCDEKGISFVGCGVSGGEEGALHGSSIMPGCTKDVYQSLEPILSAISARDFLGNPCVTHIGEGGSGHFVKMVHNGIEYAVMQMIAEVYEVYRKIYSLEAPEIGKIFETYNEGILDSYLIEITAKVLGKEDTLSGGYLINQILDRAGAKGTGLWTSVDALESGMSVSSIVEATFARMISSDKALRKTLGKGYEFSHPSSMPLEEMRIKLEHTLYLGMLFAYAQGLALIQKQSKDQNWNVNLAEVTRIWQGGCIIRSQILAFLTEAFGHGEVDHIFALPRVRDTIHAHLSDYQETLASLIRSSIATPALSSALQYFYQMVTIDSSANMIQAQRDFFGAHTHERTDREGVFHTDWN